MEIIEQHRSKERPQSHDTIGPYREKTCLRWFENNKGADKPAHADKPVHLHLCYSLIEKYHI